MAEDDKVLIVKKSKTGGEFGFSAKLRKKSGGNKIRYYQDYYNFPDNYVKNVDPQDPNDLALFFEDLSLMVGAPIEKAFLKFKERRGRNYPFF